MEALPVSFYARDTVEVARNLIGKTLVRQNGADQITGMITETEAYRGEEDLACHCRVGRTPRTEIMYGPAGRAYVYLIYGMYWLLNVVTEATGSPGAVLIRGIEPLNGIEVIARRRAGQARSNWTNGPGKLSLALDIQGEMNGANLTSSTGSLYITEGELVAPQIIRTGPRVGLETVPEPWRSKAWRFMVDYQSLKGV